MRGRTGRRERAGVVERAEVPIDALRGVAAQRGDVSLGPIDKASLDHVHACYLAVAAELDGMLAPAAVQRGNGGEQRGHGLAVRTHRLQ